MAVYKAKAKFVKRTLRFKIFYDDGSTYTLEDGPADRAPKRGVQVIIIEDDELGRKIERKNDYYVFTSYGWRGVDQFGLYDYLTQPGYKLVLFGRTMQDSEWKALWDRVIKDDYLPPKSAYTEEEQTIRPK